MRSKLREALMLGHMLCQTTSSSAGPVMPDEAQQDAFIDTIAQGNLGLADDVCVAASSLPDRAYSWPLKERDLITQVPELKQFCVWGMSLGSDTSENEPDSLPSTPSSPPAATTLGPEDFQPTIDLETTVGPAASASRDRGPAEGGAPNDDRPRDSDAHSLLQTSDFAGPRSPLLAVRTDHDDVDPPDDLSSLVQVLMNASDVEADPADGDAAENLEYSRWGPRVRAEVMQTLDTLWERGDEMVVEAVAQRIMQMGGQMQDTSVTHRCLWHLAHAVKPFLRSGRPPTYLAPAWTDWVDVVLHDVWMEVRLQRRRHAAWTLLADNSNCPQGLALFNFNNPHFRHGDDEQPTAEHDAVSMLSADLVTSTYHRAVRDPGPGYASDVVETEDLDGDSFSLVARRPGTRRWGKPAHSLSAPSASVTETWVSTTATGIASFDPSTPWRRHAAPRSGARGRDRPKAKAKTVAHKPKTVPKAKPRPRVPGSAVTGPQAVSSRRPVPPATGPACRTRDRGTGSSAAPVTARRDAATTAPPLGTDSQQVNATSSDDEGVVQDFATQLALDAADTWRPLLGIDHPVPPEDDQGGMLPQLRQTLGRRVLAMTPAEKVRLLAYLNVFVSTLVQEVSAYVEATTPDEPPPGPLLDEADAADLPEGADATHEAGEWEVEEEEPEDDVLEAEGDDQAFMQTRTSSPSTCTTPPSALTLAFVIQTLLNAMAELPPDASMTVARRMLDRLGSFDADHLCVTLLRHALQPLAVTATTTSGPVLPLSLELANFLAKWWGILLKHLPQATQEDVPTGQEAPGPTSSTSPCHVGTQTEEMAATHALDVLVTASSSVDQVSSKMARLFIPQGEAVALTLVAAVQSTTASSCLRPCSESGLANSARPLPRGVAPGSVDGEALCHVHSGVLVDPLRATDLSVPSSSVAVEGVQSTMLSDTDNSSLCEPLEYCPAALSDVELADVPVQAPAPKRCRGPE